MLIMRLLTWLWILKYEPRSSSHFPTVRVTVVLLEWLRTSTDNMYEAETAAISVGKIRNVAGVMGGSVGTQRSEVIKCLLKHQLSTVRSLVHIRAMPYLFRLLIAQCSMIV